MSLPSEGKTHLSEFGWRTSFSGERFLGLIQEALGNPSGAGERFCPSVFCWGEFGGVVDILLSLSLYLWGNRRRERRRRWKMMGLACLSFFIEFFYPFGGKAGEREKKDKGDDAACPACHSLPCAAFWRGWIAGKSFLLS